MGPFLLSDEFGEMLLHKSLRLVGMLASLCVVVPIVVPVLLMCLHSVLRFVDLVVLVVGWSVCGGVTVSIMESFSGGS